MSEAISVYAISILALSSFRTVRAVRDAQQHFIGGWLDSQRPKQRLTVYGAASQRALRCGVIQGVDEQLDPIQMAVLKLAEQVGQRLASPLQNPNIIYSRKLPGHKMTPLVLTESPFSARLLPAECSCAQPSSEH